LLHLTGISEKGHPLHGTEVLEVGSKVLWNNAVAQSNDESGVLQDLSMIYATKAVESSSVKRVGTVSID